MKIILPKYNNEVLLLKKYYLLFFLFSLIIILVGCSSSNMQSVESLNFPIREDMVLESNYESSVEDTSVEVSIYVVENGSLNSFLFEYEKNLNENGWTTARDFKPNGLVVEKNNKAVTILAYEQEGKLMVDIIPTPKVEE